LFQGLPTERFYKFASVKNVLSQGYPITYCGDGDGTVAIESLQICQSWKNQNGEFSVDFKEYEGQSHVGILTDTGFINDLLQIVKDSQ
jgi:hypothetical protein